MMQYAAYISTYYDFKMKILQIYYYTGDKPIQWSQGKGQILSDSVAILNQFHVIDAGRHDAWKMLKSGNTDYASLGLLARNIDRQDQFIADLISLVQKQNQGIELIKALVGCVAVASLRNRDSQILGMLSEKMKTAVAEDPFVRSIREHMSTDMRALANEFYKRVQRLKHKVRGDFPTEFLDWAMTVATSDEIEALETASMMATTFEQLVEVAQVSWRPECDPKLG